jgi:hypothetical protein
MSDFAAGPAEKRGVPIGVLLHRGDRDDPVGKSHLPDLRLPCLRLSSPANFVSAWSFRGHGHLLLPACWYVAMSNVMSPIVVLGFVT